MEGESEISSIITRYKLIKEYCTKIYKKFIVVLTSWIIMSKSKLEGVLPIYRLGYRCPRREDRREVVKLGAGGALDLAEMLEHFFSEIVEILGGVFIFDCFDWKVDLLVEAVSGVVLVVFWDSIVDFDTQSHASLISPTS